LELSIYSSTPDGELVKQRWWVEAKGRNKTVGPRDVKSAVLNAAGKSTIDVMVIATNAAFSNPTRDWVKEWQEENPRPKIKLWERTELENLCSKNPIAVIRVFRHALSLTGKLEVLTTKLWDYVVFTEEFTLKELWKEKKQLSIDFRALVALVASEFANGDITARSWGMAVGEDTLVESLGNGLLNLPFLIFRTHESGAREEPLIKGLAYLVLISTIRNGADYTAELIRNVWESVEVNFPDEIRNFVLEPILRTLNSEIRDVCTSDCSRITTNNVILSEDDVERYWNRLRVSKAVSESPEKKKILTLEKNDGKCNVGFALNAKVGCPLCHQDAPHQNVPEVLQVIETVAKFRCKRE
jgi:hypothetical protein